MSGEEAGVTASGRKLAKVSTGRTGSDRFTEQEARVPGSMTRSGPFTLTSR